jgi:hypothetical protein
MLLGATRVHKVKVERARHRRLVSYELTQGLNVFRSEGLTEP